MPFHFKIKDDISEFVQSKSILIIPCRFCPAASSAVSNNKPYFEIFRKFLKTDSYEKYINDLKSKLENRGIKTTIFKSRLIHQFVLCMWTSKRRNKLRKKADEYESIIVLGCEAAVQTIRDSVNLPSNKILQGLETEGVMSIKPKFTLPCNLSLDMESLTPLVCPEKQSIKASS
jgi:hypothetical protein